MVDPSIMNLLFLVIVVILQLSIQICPPNDNEMTMKGARDTELGDGR